MRFRTKTILGVALIEMVLLAVLVASTLSILRDSTEAELERRVELGGRLLAAASKDAVLAEDLATLDSLAAATMASGQVVFVRILNSSGKSLAQRGDPALLARHEHPEGAPGQAHDGVLGRAVPIESGGIRYGEVRLAVSTAPLDLLLGSVGGWGAGIAAVEMALVALFSWLLGSYLVRQLDALRQASARMGGGDFSQPVPVRGDDELAETAHAFNRMATQIGHSRRELEMALERIRDRTAQLDAIFALSPDGLVSFDAGRCVRYASPAFLHMTGLAEADLDGLDAAEFAARLASRCEEGASRQGLALLNATAEVGAGDTATGVAAAAPRCLIVLAAPVRRVLEVGLRRSASETVSQILYFRDVTHETEVERLKSEFVAHAAHELRTPMSAIYGFTELLLAQEFPPEEQREFLDTIYQQSSRMIEIINALLDLVRIEERRGADFRFERLDAAQVFAGLVADFVPPGGRASPAWQSAGASCPIRIDPARLAQAVTNVLSNAYKYSPGGGGIEASLVTDGDGAEGGRVGLRIVDHGIGMTAEQLARVGERFFRADTSGKIPGTGLGICIAREILDLHGGRLDLESQFGVGTTATLWLPAHSRTVVP